MRAILLAIALAQVGLIIQSRLPDEARALSRRAAHVHKAVSERLKRGPVTDAGRRKMLALASELSAAAKKLQADEKDDVGLSLNEKDAVDRALQTTKDVCAWLERHARPPSPEPK